MNDIIENVTNTNNPYIMKIGENAFISILTTESQNNNSNSNMSMIDLGECENDLKKVYKINEPLLIIKMDYFPNDTFIPMVEYEVYNPITLELLDLSLCTNNSDIKINFPVTIDDSSLFKHDPNSEYYKSICYIYTTEYGTDIIVEDRQKEFGDKNLSLCENNCEYKGYNADSKLSNCICKIKNKMRTITQIKNNPNNLLNEFTSKDISKSLFNFKFLKCAGSLFTTNGLKINISNYIFIAIFVYFIFSIFTFRKFGYAYIKNEIQDIMVIKEQEELKRINKKAQQETENIYNNNNNNNANPLKKSRTDSIKNNESKKNIIRQSTTSTKSINVNILPINKEEIDNKEDKDKKI